MSPKKGTDSAARFTDECEQIGDGIDVSLFDEALSRVSKLNAFGSVFSDIRPPVIEGVHRTPEIRSSNKANATKSWYSRYEQPPFGVAARVLRVTLNFVKVALFPSLLYDFRR
jgi:hypothetical protein